MKRAVLLIAVLGCGEEKKEKPFGIDPPPLGAQIHLERATLDPMTQRTICEERILGSASALLSDAGAGDAGAGNDGPLRVVAMELLATPVLKRIEVYALDEASGAPAGDCPLLPVSIMGDLSEPIRMVYYADVSGAVEEAVDHLTIPGGAAIPLDDDQPLLLRYAVQTGAEAEDLEVFLNLSSNPDASEVAAPYTLTNRSITIPATTNIEVETTCLFDYAHDVLTVAGHQHDSTLLGQPLGAGIGVTVTHDGKAVLSGRAGPWAVLAPLEIPAGGGLTFSCAYNNNSSDTIVHGKTEFDEMCRIFGWLTGANRAVMATAFDASGQSKCDVNDDEK